MTQSFSFYEDLTIAENLELRRRALPADAARASMSTDTLDELGLTSPPRPARRHAVGRLEAAAGARRLHHAQAASSCCSTSRRPASTPRRGASSGTRSTGWPRRADRAGLDPLHGRGRALPPHQLHLLWQADRRAARSTRWSRDAGLHHLRRRGPGLDEVARGARAAAGRRPGRALRHDAACRRPRRRRCSKRRSTTFAQRDRHRGRAGRDQPRGRVHPVHGRRRRTTWHERRSSPSPARRAARQGVHPDAARPHHLRDDAGRAADAARAVRLCDQQRPEGPARGARRPPATTTTRRAMVSALETDRLLPLRPCRRQRGGGRGADRSAATSPSSSPSRPTSRARVDARRPSADPDRGRRDRPGGGERRHLRRSARSPRRRCCASTAREAEAAASRPRASSRSWCTGATIPRASRNTTSCPACSASSCR